MKILMVTRENEADKRYGLGKSLAPLLVEFQHRGIPVYYLCQTEVGTRSLNTLRLIHKLLTRLLGRWFKNTELSPLLWGILERLNMGRLAAKVMVQGRYSHVHCHDPIIAAGYRAFARIRWYATLRLGHIARWGISEHGFGCYAEAFHCDGARLGTGTRQWLRNWEAKVLSKAHWVLVPTHLGLMQLARDLAVYPIPAHWYFVYHPKPILSLYSKAQARQLLGWDMKVTYIIAVGRFAPLKQFPNLIKACARLPGNHRWQLSLIGEGDRAPLQQLAIELGMGERLSFAISEDMGLYYAACDFYVSTSSTESFGLANLEAVSLAVPSLCTAVGGVPEVVGSGAWLIPAEDELALQTALCQLLTQPALRDHWSSQARQWGKDWVTVPQVANAYLAMYEGRVPGVPFAKGGEKPGKAVFPCVAPLDFNNWQQQLQNKPLCPLPKSLTLPTQAKVLMIAPHPDDETLGCGGTLNLWRQCAGTVKVVIVTDGGAGDPEGYLGTKQPLTESGAQVDEETVDTQIATVITHRKQESLAALHVLGIEDVVFWEYPDGNYQHNVDVKERMLNLLEEYQADWLLIPSVLDYHRDHVSISLSVLEAWQALGCRERLLIYESWAPIPANWVVDVSEVFAVKQRAINCYQLPLQYCDYLKACVGMAKYRGLYLGVEYAEAFLELKSENWPAVVQGLWGVQREVFE